MRRRGGLENDEERGEAFGKERRGYVCTLAFLKCENKVRDVFGPR